MPNFKYWTLKWDIQYLQQKISKYILLISIENIVTKKFLKSLISASLCNVSNLIRCIAKVLKIDYQNLLFENVFLCYFITGNGSMSILDTSGHH